MKKKIFTLAVCLASLSLIACQNDKSSESDKGISDSPISTDSTDTSKASESSSESTIVQKETTVDTIYDALTSLKDATSYKSSFAKEGFSSKTLIYTSNYIYSSKTGSGHILLSGFKADQDKASFAFTLSGTTVSVSFADMNGKDYLSSLDSFVSTKKLAVTKDMLRLNDTGKRVILEDEDTAELLLDLIGGQNEDNPYEISTVEIYYNRYNELILAFYEGDAKVDEAAVSDINSASEKTLDAYLAGDGSTLLTEGSLTSDKMTNVISDDLEVTSKIQKIVTSVVSDESSTYLKKSATELYRNKSNKYGEIVDQEAYVLDEDECFTEYYLSVDNTVDTHYNEDDYWTDVFDISSVDPELFKKSSGNNYDYYGGKADTILANLINDKDATYGKVTALYAVVKDGQVKSFTFNLDGGYVITSTFATPTGEVPSITVKDRVTGVGDRLETAFNALKYSASTTGFATSMNVRGHGSEYNTVEGIYSSDVVMTYNRSITNSDSMRYEGNGYQVKDGNLFAFNIGGLESGEGDTLSKDYSFSGVSESEGSLSTKWFSVIASPDVFYKKAGTDNTFVMYKGLLNSEKAFPISLVYGEEVTDISVVLDSSDKVSEIHFQVSYNGEDEGESVMKFTYGSESSPVVTSDMYTKLTAAYEKMNEVNDFTGLNNVYGPLHNDEPDHAVSDDVLKDIPYLAVTGGNSKWTAAFAYDSSSWSTNYNQFTVTLNATTISGFDLSDYLTKYIALLDAKTSYTKTGSTTTELNDYGDTTTTTTATYTNSTLKYSLVAKTVDDTYYGEQTFEITVNLL